ncbi:hypothetical protein SLEP1_g2946 [Rubroshorea leprosula]|uniref:HAT C-terminal dimerisation domain-containing protein n=1 Tax=Rubroshorea leprosula TaxID=152421 RepID=A0AAV5HIR5_9ROSI|nr:hypothetical protein SLEP1_g2946 [Rubroshorea leprosula]
MARDVLAMLISTVASEATCSTGGRVLDEFRSSLTPRMVQALICSQDWLKSKARQVFDIEDDDELGRLEKEFEKLKFDASVI